MFKRHYLTGALVVLSLAAGSAVASAAPIVHHDNPHSQAQFNQHRGLYDYPGPQAGYDWYGYQWDPYTWSTGNGYY
jgi:hypothetical protein